MPEIVLETVGLTMNFGGVVASDNVDFRLKEGELRCLIGPNGAGKSTFFKCIAGLQTPSSGQVFMRGQETTHWTSHQVASLGVGIKTQVPSVLDSLSVFENIWLAARRFMSKAEANDKTHQVIERFSLQPIVNSDLGRLAHGERQRVELGMVTVADPWLILLDEPAAGMTAEEVDKIGEVITELTNFSSIIIVEHDMQFIRSIASTVTVFHQGRVLMEDNVDVVMSDPVLREIYLGKKP
jgi:branched-chain amino acid transport system ATP-binding protein